MRFSDLRFFLAERRVIVVASVVVAVVVVVVVVAGSRSIRLFGISLSVRGSVIAAISFLVLILLLS